MFRQFAKKDRVQSENKSSSHTSYKKTTIPKKSARSQHGNEGHPPNCECDQCCSEYPLRTHLLLDMKSYSRLDQLKKRKSGLAGFSFFGRKKHTCPNAVPKEDWAPSSRDQYPSLVEGEMSGVSSQGLTATGEPMTLANLKQDSLMIPVARMEHFFPAGHPIPTSSNTGGRLRLLETPEPSVHIAIHMLGPPTPITPSIQWQLNDPHEHMKSCVTKGFKAVVAAVGTQFLQGMVLLNLERGGELGPVEFPFIVVWVVDGAKCDHRTVVDKIRTISYEQLDPIKTGFKCEHYFDTYEEVATLAKPPIENLSRKPTSKTTGYIVRVFKVFEGDDGEKFERNWLMWTGARLLYKSISAEVGLRRLTLHKSEVQNGTHIYILLCDMANFLTNICQAVKAIPALRMSLCGDTGLYRPICSL